MQANKLPLEFYSMSLTLMHSPSITSSNISSYVFKLYIWIREINSLLFVMVKTQDESLEIVIEIISYAVTITVYFVRFKNEFLKRINLSCGFKLVMLPCVSLIVIIPEFTSRVSPSPSESVSFYPATSSLLEVYFRSLLSLVSSSAIGGLYLSFKVCFRPLGLKIFFLESSKPLLEVSDMGIGVSNFVLLL